MKEKCLIHVEIICCLMNYGDVKINSKENFETIEVASKYLGQGVCLLDIAGAETDNMMDFEMFFKEAQNRGIPYIIHAGEAGSSENVRSAIKLGARRIGHGVRSIEDASVVQELVNNNIPIEVCISSNINCKVFDSFENHPVKKLKDQGVIVTINTDNMMFSNTNLDKEYEILKSIFGFTDEDLIQFNRNAVAAGACKNDVKGELFKLFDE